MSVGSSAAKLLGDTSGISNLASSLAARLGGSAISYFSQLSQASYRGFPFISLGGESAFGRRNALHEYPKRDVPWVEDMGRAARRIRMTGYIVGDDVIQQRDQLIALAETNGDGDLVHPTLGRLTVSLMEFSNVEVWDKGRYFELQFSFIESGARVYPDAAAATGAAVASAGLSADLAAAAAFGKAALSAVAYGASVVGEAVSTALSWYSAAKSVVGDARNLFQLVTNLPGDFGRFIGASPLSDFASPMGRTSPPGATTQSLIAASVTERMAVNSAGAALGEAAHALDASSIDLFSSAAQDVVAAVLAATPDPSNSIRLLSQLADFSPTPITQVSTIGAAMGVMQSACADLFRRSAVIAIARASAAYEPTSSDDAFATRNVVTDLIDAEIDVGGDQAEDSVYDSMRTLRAAVVTDLNARGAALPSIKAFSMRASLPALALANQIYRDAGRADGLVEQANPIHPAFMPLAFNALAQ